MAIRLFRIRSRFWQSDHIRSGFCQSFPIRSDPGFVNAREQQLQTGLVNLFHLFIFFIKGPCAQFERN